MDHLRWRGWVARLQYVIDEIQNSHRYWTSLAQLEVGDEQIGDLDRLAGVHASFLREVLRNLLQNRKGVYAGIACPFHRIA
jgi:hypothetical protein